MPRNGVDGGPESPDGGGTVGGGEGGRLPRGGFVIRRAVVDLGRAASVC